MSQQQVITFLKSNPGRWFSATEIAEAIKIGKSAILSNLKSLRYTNFINYKFVEGFNSKMLPCRKAYVYKIGRV